MSYAQKEGLFEVAKAAVFEKVLDADFTTDAIDTRNLFSGSVWVDWSAASAADATVKIQEGPTADGPWQDRTGATITISAAGPLAKKIAIADVDSTYMRAVATKNSETTAKVTIRFYFKGAR